MRASTSTFFLAAATFLFLSPSSTLGCRQSGERCMSASDACCSDGDACLQWKTGHLYCQAQQCLENGVQCQGRVGVCCGDNLCFADGSKTGARVCMPPSDVPPEKLDQLRQKQGKA